MKSRVGIMFVKNCAKYAKGMKLIDIGYLLACVGVAMVGVGSMKIDNSTGDAFSGDNKEFEKLNKAFNTVYEDHDKHVRFSVQPNKEK